MKPDMITRIAPVWQAENWQKSLAEAIRDPAELLQILELSKDLLPAAQQAASSFPLRAPLSYINRIEKGNPQDPLLLQILPLHTELDTPPEGFTTDPVGDLGARPVPGLLHKYHGRALLITTGACAIHCRYCFRRHYPYQDGCSSPGNLDRIVDYLQDDESIEELILSGGDPLSLSTARLAELGQQLLSIPHIKRLRLHTRLPIVLPERIDTDLLNWLQSLPVQTIMVIHSNHAREIDARVHQVLKNLQHTGIHLLNQSVLLRGINDSLESLKALSETLFEASVMPYYLHQLDKVVGAQHFGVSDETAVKLVQNLAQQLPGYLVPKLVREIAGEAAKTPLRAKVL